MKLEKLIKDIEIAGKTHFPTCPTRRGAFKKGAYEFMNAETETMFEQWMEWSSKTFEKAGKYESLQKLKDEIKELEESYDPDEYADCFMCLLHSMARAGVSLESLLIAFNRKFAVNKGRTWILNENNTYSHKK